MARTLEGQVALVTGASRGIGRAVAKRLAAEGASVGITARDQLALEATRSDIEEAGGRALAVPGDVTVPADVKGCLDEVGRRLGPLDILVNNAGRAAPSSASFTEIDPTDWWNAIEVNLRGPMLFMRGALPEMIERGRGRIFNIGSLIADGRTAGFSHYAVSKAALIRLTDAVSMELAGTGVSVLDVSPGLVKTDMTEGLDVFQNVPDESWTPIERAAEVIVQLCGSTHDGLSGRFLHAADDIEVVAKALAEDPEGDGRKMRLLPYGPADELLT